MKRVVIDRFGGPEVLQVVEVDVPRPGPGEVRVRVLAAGVSFTDSQLRAGTYLGVPKPPFTPGYELVGVVEDWRAGGPWSPGPLAFNRQATLQMMPPLVISESEVD